jgi:hypothetical protein
MPDTARTLDDARETLAILEETERFLVRDVGAGGKLTLEDTGRWADELRRCRGYLEAARAEVRRLEAAQR